MGVGRRRVLCIDCLCGALPFIWIPREGDYRRALQEHRGGRHRGLQTWRDPFDDDVRAILGAIDTMLRRCKYTGYGDLAGRQWEVSTRGAVPWP